MYIVWRDVTLCAGILSNVKLWAAGIDKTVAGMPELMLERVREMGIKPWTDYFLDLAKTCASRSNCLRANVGAVIVGEDKKIKATGYNGTPSGVESCYERGECYRIKNNIPSGTKYETCRSIHAEQNAIIQAGQDRCKGATIYIWGHDIICILCKRFIVQAGIKDVYLRKDENSPVLYVSVEDIKRELEEQQ